MTFSVYLPPAVIAEESKAAVPVLFWLSGLECTDQNFAQKAVNAFKVAAQKAIAIVLSDTSPRGAGCKDDKVSWDFGEGAGFYVDATEDDYKNHYRMHTYVVEELPQVAVQATQRASGEARLDVSRKSISGHSMGGHGALTIYLKHSEKFRSCSAFAPIAHPSACPWGQKAFTGYLGADKSKWAEYDATELVKTKTNDRTRNQPILIHQGSKDRFLENQLLPQDFLAAAKEASQPVTYEFVEGYDHGYFFIASFIEQHIEFHASYLNQ